MNPFRIVALGSSALALAWLPANAQGVSPGVPVPAVSSITGDCTSSGNGAVSLVCLDTNGVPFTTAATTPLGTSGADIPLLSTTNTWGGAQTFAASTTAGAGLNITPGVAPTSPANGAFWITSAGVYAQAGGTTYTLGSGSGFASLGANTFTGLQNATEAGVSSLFYNFGTTTGSASGTGNGLYLGASNQINISINGSSVCEFTSTGINACSIGQSGGGLGTFSTLTLTTLKNGSGETIVGASAPTVSAGFGSGPTVTAHSNTNAFIVTVGTSPGGTGVLSLPATGVSNGWACEANDLTSNSSVTVSETATLTNSATFAAYSRTTGLAVSFNASDVIQFVCFPY